MVPAIRGKGRRRAVTTGSGNIAGFLRIWTFQSGKTVVKSVPPSGRFTVVDVLLNGIA